MRLCYDQYGVNRFFLGSGGSAFNDGGFGAVRAMNVFDFKHENGESIPIDHPIFFQRIILIQFRNKPLRHVAINNLINFRRREY